MGLVPYIQAALTLTLAVVAILALAAVRSMRGDVRDLLAALRKSRPRADPGPGASVVTPGSPGPRRAETAASGAAPPAAPRPVPREELVELDEAALAAIDAMAAARGLTREAMILVLVQMGAARGLPANANDGADPLADEPGR